MVILNFQLQKGNNMEYLIGAAITIVWLSTLVGAFLFGQRSIHTAEIIKRDKDELEAEKKYEQGIDNIMKYDFEQALGRTK